MVKALLMAACLSGACGAVLAGKASAPPAARAVDADFARGEAVAKADFAAGRGGWYFHWYSNMPNGPDDPVLARERDLFVALLYEKGIEPKNSSTGCIPDSSLPRFAEGYNAIAEPLLKKKYGADYMILLKQEVARRMQAAPQAG